MSFCLFVLSLLKDVVVFSFLQHKFPSLLRQGWHLPIICFFPAFDSLIPFMLFSMVLLPMRSLRFILRLYETIGLLTKKSFILRSICKMFQFLFMILPNGGKVRLNVVIIGIRLSGSLLLSLRGSLLGVVKTFPICSSMNFLLHPLEWKVSAN